MKVCVITCTKNRHTCLERSVRYFLDQDYDNCVQLIFNNSSEILKLSDEIPENKVILVNNHIDYNTGKGYKTLGAIYNDAITHIPEDVDVIGFWDDDDLFLPNHISEGVKGLQRGQLTAYKPKFSFYKSGKIKKLVENTMEPSIFVKKSHIIEHGFGNETSAQHLKWVDPLVSSKQIYVDPDGIPTLIYMWGENIPVFKTSGDPNNPNNFQNYHNFAKDVGDGVITPISKNSAQRFIWSKMT